MEDLFRAWGLEFQRVGLSNSPRSISEMVQVGENDSPWYCSEEYVYKVFEFSSMKPFQAGAPDPTDIFIGVKEETMGIGCL